MRQKIQNVRVWGITEGNERADLFLRNGVIEGVGLGGAVDRVWEGRGALAIPSLIDLGVVFGEPGFGVREDLDSGLRAAAAGGFGAVVMMPETDPVVDDPALVRQLLERASTISGARLHVAVALTRGQAGTQLSDMAALADAGAVMVSDGEHQVRDSHLFRRACEYASELGLLVLGASLEETLSPDGVIHEGAVSERLGLAGQPESVELLALFRDAEIARMTGARVHFPRLTTAMGLRLASWMREQGAPITWGTTPHHLVLAEDVAASFEPVLKVSPPLRPASDVKALRQALLDGEIDCLSTDHRPWTRAEKELDIVQAPSGIAGLETAWAVMYTSLVLPRLVPLARLVHVWTEGPARVMGWPTPTLHEGARADITLVDLETPRAVDADDLVSRARMSPWQGQNLCGWPIATFVQGRCVFQRRDVFSTSALPGL